MGGKGGLRWVWLSRSFLAGAVLIVSRPNAVGLGGRMRWQPTRFLAASSHWFFASFPALVRVVRSLLLILSLSLCRLVVSGEWAAAVRVRVQLVSRPKGAMTAQNTEAGVGGLT